MQIFVPFPVDIETDNSKSFYGLTNAARSQMTSGTTSYQGKKENAYFDCYRWKRLPNLPKPYD